MIERGTPLYDLHLRSARDVVKGGGDFVFPTSYASPVEEHLNVRRHVGMQDLSTMGEVDVRGPGPRGSSGRAAKLGFHRDTWSSNVYSQTNWWAPIYPITPGRTLAFYPGYWSRPLKNTSGGWDLEDVRARRSAGEPVALVPEPDEPVDIASELRPVILPGACCASPGRACTPACPTLPESPASLSRSGRWTPSTRRWTAARPTWTARLPASP